jgi:hypothetical protein
MNDWMICALCGGSQENDPNGTTWLIGDNDRNIHQSCGINMLVDMKHAWDEALAGDDDTDDTGEE